MKTFNIIALFSLYFLSFPMLTDPNLTAKFYLFVFVVFFFVLINIFFGKTSSIVVDAPGLFFLLFVSLCFVSAVFARDISSALMQSVFFLTGGVFFVLIRNLSASNKHIIDQGIFLLILIAIAFACFGLLQYNDFILNGRRDDMIIPYFLPSTGSRLAGPFGQPNFQATVMLIGLCCLASLYKINNIVLQPLWVRVGVSVVASLLLLNFFLANSRSGIVSLILIICLILFYGRHLLQHKIAFIFSKKEVLWIVSIATISWILYLQIGSLPLAEGQQLDVVRSESGIFNRINMWVATLWMALDHPILGIGPDNFKNYLPDYQIMAHGVTKVLFEDMLYTRWAHNEYLQILAEGGLLAFTAFMAFLFVSAKLILQRVKASSAHFVFVPMALIPLLIHGGLEWPLRYPPLFVTFLFLLAVSLPPEFEGFELRINNALRKSLPIILCLLILTAGSWAFYWEVKAGLYLKKTQNIEIFYQTFDQFEVLSRHPVTAHTMLKQSIYYFIPMVVREDNHDLAANLSDVVEQIIYLEGAAWQWYNLSRLQFTALRHTKAKYSVERSLDLDPIYEPAWQFLHHLNILRAAEITGKPIEYFQPGYQEAEVIE